VSRGQRLRGAVPAPPPPRRETLGGASGCAPHPPGGRHLLLSSGGGGGWRRRREASGLPRAALLPRPEGKELSPAQPACPRPPRIASPRGEPARGHAWERDRAGPSLVGTCRADWHLLIAPGRLMNARQRVSISNLAAAWFAGAACWGGTAGGMPKTSNKSFKCSRQKLRQMPKFHRLLIFLFKCILKKKS